ncbi:MAG: hypothetical protein P8Z30_13550 [Acidobacteriota bacterium]
MNTGILEPTATPFTLPVGTASKVVLANHVNRAAIASILAIEIPVDPPGFTGLQLAHWPTSPVSRTKLITDQASATRRELDEIRLRRCDAHSHWGLNE